MRLIEALKRARSAISPDKHNERGRHVLLDFEAGREGFVTAFDGAVTTRYTVEPDVMRGKPDGTALEIAVSMDQVAPLIGHAQDVIGLDWVSGGAALSMTVRNANGAEASACLNVLPPKQFRFVPIPDVTVWGPEYEHCEPCAVADFVGDDPAAVDYHYVQGRADGVAASDMITAATVSIETPWRGMIAPGLFTNWMRGFTARSGHCEAGAHAVWDDEHRYTPYETRRDLQVWPRLKPLEPYEGPWCVVEIKPLISALKQAKGCSKTGVVWLHHAPDGLQLQAETDGGGHAYAAPIDVALAQGNSEEPLAFSGARLLAVLKAAVTPCVMLSQAHCNSPLRIESGRLVAAVWRMTLDPTKERQGIDGPRHS